MKGETIDRTYLPFKIGSIVNGFPIWLEARIPYSSNLEEMLRIREIMKDTFDTAVRSLKEKLRQESSAAGKKLSAETC